LSGKGNVGKKDVGKLFAIGRRQDCWERRKRLEIVLSKNNNLGIFILHYKIYFIN